MPSSDSHTQFAAVMEPQPDGGFTVTFPDLPEVVTQGDSREEAIANAAEALTLALQLRIEDGKPLPVASKVPGGTWIVPRVAVLAAPLIRRVCEDQGIDRAKAIASEIKE